MGHVFISYSSRHRELTQKFVSLLERDGFPVWWDHDLEAWGEYEPQIREAIEAAVAVIVIWSDGAVKSRFVKAEVEKAMRMGRLVNLRAPDFPIDLVPLNYAAVDHIQTLDLEDINPVIRTLRTVWEGRVPEGSKPAHSFYREVYGEDLFDSRRQPIPEDSAVLTPSLLLQAPYTVVDYADATGQLAGMLDWCSGSGIYVEKARPSAGRLIYGPGGLGKTRLMIETVRNLRAQGWLAGFLPAAVPGDAARARHRHRAIEQVMATTGPEPGVLMVLDYAEARREDVIALSRLATARPSNAGRPLQIVLLARSDPWWQDLYATEPEVQVLFNKRGAPHGDIHELATVPKGDERLALFDAMRAALRPQLARHAEAGLFPPLSDVIMAPDRRMRLAEDAAYARPLALQMEAMLSLVGETGDAVADLLDKILRLERRHWRRVIDGLDPDSDREESMRRGITQITAVGGIEERAARALLRGDGFFGPRALANLPLRELGRLYGRSVSQGPRDIAGLEPDLVGEHEILQQADEDLIKACRTWITSLPVADRAPRTRQLFTVLQRASRPEHGPHAATAQKLLTHAIRDIVPEEAAILIGVAVETPGPLAALLTATVPTLAPDMLDALFKAMPEQTVALLHCADALAERRLMEARARFDVSTASAEDRAALAGHLFQRGRTLSGLGQFEAALNANGESVGLLRELAKHNSGAFEFGLASSLTNLGGLLSKLGKLEQALAIMQEVLAIQRRLFIAHPDNFGPYLAMALHNLGACFIKLRRQNEALSPEQEAVTIYRRLAAVGPAAFDHELAASLENLSIIFSDLKRFEEALATVQKAVAIQRRLVIAHPDAFGGDLVMSLVNLGWFLKFLGRREQAIVAMAEVVAHLRRLADLRPAVFEIDLAMILSRLGHWLSEFGRFKEALDATEEAVFIIRRLAAALTGGFDPLLAASLNNLSEHLLPFDRAAEAVSAAEEGIALLSPYHTRHPEEHQALMTELRKTLAAAHLAVKGGDVS